MIKRALLSTFRRIVRLYFRQIERVGDTPGADTRGRVFVANHHNALVDPILVLTDAPCEISPIAKSTLWNIPGLRWLLDAAGAVPLNRRKDNPDKDAATTGQEFDKIAGHLTGGGNILIFPEGTSHSEPQLAPLRTGAARMLLAADERRRTQGGVPLTFQAAALEFDAVDKFRSRCLLLWGPVRKFAEVDGHDDEARVRAATSIMEADLKELLVEGQTHAERRLIARVAELFANDAGDSSLERWNAIGRKVEQANQTLRGMDRILVDYVEFKVNRYYAELARLGLRDDQLVGGGAPDPISTNGLKLALLAPLAIPGIVLYAVPYWVPRLVARSADQDAASTYKLAAGLVVYPLWMAGLVGASLAFVPSPWKLPAVAVAVLSPFAALAWLDAWTDQANHRAISDDERARLAELRAGATLAIATARASVTA
jgi:glycerol-3-phosphate O-acyltransferase/dihydroxyacetone phosphate acyltransferase